MMATCQSEITTVWNDNPFNRTSWDSWGPKPRRQTVTTRTSYADNDKFRWLKERKKWLFCIHRGGIHLNFTLLHFIQNKQRKGRISAVLILKLGQRTVFGTELFNNQTLLKWLLFIFCRVPRSVSLCLDIRQTSPCRPSTQMTCMHCLRTIGMGRVDWHPVGSAFMSIVDYLRSLSWRASPKSQIQA